LHLCAQGQQLHHTLYASLLVTNYQCQFASPHMQAKDALFASKCASHLGDMCIAFKRCLLPWATRYTNLA